MMSRYKLDLIIYRWQPKLASCIFLRSPFLSTPARLRSCSLPWVSIELPLALQTMAMCTLLNRLTACLRSFEPSWNILALRATASSSQHSRCLCHPLETSILYVSKPTATQDVSVFHPLCLSPLSSYHNNEWFTVFWKDTQKAKPEFLEVLYFSCPLHASASSHGNATGWKQEYILYQQPLSPSPLFLSLSLSLYPFSRSVWLRSAGH